MASVNAHATVTNIFQVLASTGALLYHISNLDRPKSLAKESESLESRTIPIDSSGYQELPDSYKNAVTGIESKDWIEASNHELNGLKKLKTWSVGDLPINKKALRLRWCFTK